MPTGIYKRIKTRMLKSYICMGCKKEFQKYASHVKTDKPACSKKCSAIGRIPPSQKGRNMGENNWRWITDRTQLKKTTGRKSRAYWWWKKQILIRDNNKCRINNNECVKLLEVHHILRWANYPELRYDINNGITLCHAHHPRGRENEAKLSPYLQSLVAEMK